MICWQFVLFKSPGCPSLNFCDCPCVGIWREWNKKSFVKECCLRSGYLLCHRITKILVSYTIALQKASRLRTQWKWSELSKLICVSHFDQMPRSPFYVIQRRDELSHILVTNKFPQKLIGAINRHDCCIFESSSLCSSDHKRLLSSCSDIPIDMTHLTTSRVWSSTLGSVKIPPSYCTKGDVCTLTLVWLAV